MTTASSPGRAAAVAAFLARHGLGGAERRPLAGDASARRYERVVRSDGSTVILVDTPNPADDLAPFIAVGALLDRLGLSAPAALAAEEAEGLALLEDFGDDTLSRLLDRGEDPRALYALAVDVLVELHRRFRPEQAAGLALPVFDARLFLEQVMLFADVWMPAAIGCPPATEDRAALESAWVDALGALEGIPTSLLLRDHHVDNLIRLPRPGVRAAGLLDFQNAGIGPVPYDLVSLLEDARRDVPADLADAMTQRYLAAFPDLDRAAFRRACSVLGAVRHARIIAVFARLAVRDGKRGYLAHLPRVWRLLEARLGAPELAAVARWFDRHLPADRRAGLAIPESA